MAATKWKKAPESLVLRFGQALPRDPAIERRSMFGYPCAFFQGHMFCGLFEDQFIVRLPEAERVAFLKQPGAKVFEPMPGRPMKEYVLIPPAVVERDALLGGWLRQSLDYVGGLPPRAKKPKKAPVARPAKAPRSGMKKAAVARPKKPSRPAAKKAARSPLAKVRSRAIGKRAPQAHAKKPRAHAKRK
jgi:TfoX/Sxy family transcriptional regulator of competence genes